MKISKKKFTLTALLAMIGGSALIVVPSFVSSCTSDDLRAVMSVVPIDTTAGRVNSFPFQFGRSTPPSRQCIEDMLAIRNGQFVNENVGKFIDTLFENVPINHTYEVLPGPSDWNVGGNFAETVILKDASSQTSASVALVFKNSINLVNESPIYINVDDPQSSPLIKNKDLDDLYASLLVVKNETVSPSPILTNLLNQKILPTTTTKTNYVLSDISYDLNSNFFSISAKVTQPNNPNNYATKRLYFNNFRSASLLNFPSLTVSGQYADLKRTLSIKENGSFTDSKQQESVLRLFKDCVTTNLKDFHLDWENAYFSQSQDQSGVSVSDYQQLNVLLSATDISLPKFPQSIGPLPIKISGYSYLQANSVPTVITLGQDGPFKNLSKEKNPLDLLDLLNGSTIGLNASDKDKGKDSPIRRWGLSLFKNVSADVKFAWLTYDDNFRYDKDGNLFVSIQAIDSPTGLPQIVATSEVKFIGFKSQIIDHQLLGEIDTKFVGDTTLTADDVFNTFFPLSGGIHTVGQNLKDYYLFSKLGYSARDEWAFKSVNYIPKSNFLVVTINDITTHQNITLVFAGISGLTIKQPEKLVYKTSVSYKDLYDPTTKEYKIDGQTVGKEFESQFANCNPII